MQVHRLPLHGTNAYVISDQHHVLVDTGPARSRSALMEGLAALQLTGSDLSLIVATHAHATSIGNAAYLQRTFHVPVAVHQSDAPIMASGVDRHIEGDSFIDTLVRVFSDTRFDAVSPDVVFGHTMSLEPFGCGGTVVHTPGHTIGSASVVLPTGDGIVGDLVMGGSLGGRLLGSRPERHYFAEDPDRVARSVALLQRLGVHWVHPGTGDMLRMSEIRSALPSRRDAFPSGPAPSRLRERRLLRDAVWANAFNP